MATKIIEQGEQFLPGLNFRLQLRIKDKAYSSSLVGVRIASSLASAYQSLELILQIAPKDAIIPSISGSDPIKLKIDLLSQNEPTIKVTSAIPKHTLELDLMLISVGFDLPVADVMPTNTTTIDRTLVRLLAVPRKPYITMTTHVNQVYGVNDDPKTPKGIIETFVSTFVPDASLKYDTKNENSNKIPQICIPPTTIYDAINHVDSSYGLFDGAASVFCQYDNTIHVMNLSSRIKKSDKQLFIYHLGMDQNPSKAINTDDNSYYTYDNLKTTYVGNTKFSVIGNSMKHIVLPSDELYSMVEQDLFEVCVNNGVVSGGAAAVLQNIPVGADVTHRQKYYILHGGVEKQSTFANAMMAKKIFDLSRVSFQIERNITLTNLLTVGQSVKLKSTPLAHKGIDGQYILFSSDIVLVKQRGAWAPTARIQLARTNRTIGQ